MFLTYGFHPFHFLSPPSPQFGLFRVQVFSWFKLVAERPRNFGNSNVDKYCHS